MCKLNRSLNVTKSDDMSAMISAGTLNSLSYAIQKMEINGQNFSALIDTGSSGTLSTNTLSVNTKYHIQKVAAAYQWHHHHSEQKSKATVR